MSEQPVFWSDQLAYGVKQKFDRDTYVCASGISPSGIVHAGNFREIITTDFVVKSLKEFGEDVKFIYSWDDYDRFRKVPENVPDEWEQYIGLPLSKVPDPEGCHDSYAEHFESRLEEELEDMYISVDFIRQTEKFENTEYARLIKKAMDNREEIREILNKYRNEPLDEDWYPLRVYCKECGKDFTEIKDWDGDYSVLYYCKECELDFEINFKENDSVKPPWRIDWPMRWHYENVDFEPAGKEHSAAGGSRDTANGIVKSVYGDEPPVHQMYEFVTKDGAKISSSSGEDLFTISTLKEVYTPEMIRFLFSNTKPNKAFEIPFETEEIFQRYDEFDTIEETYYEDSASGDSLRTHEQAVYELAMVEIPDEKPVRVPFQHASFVAQTVPEEEWETKAIESLKRTGHVPEDIEEKGIAQVTERLQKAKNWARNYAPDNYHYQINYEISDELKDDLTTEEKKAMHLLADMLRDAEFDDQDDLDGKIFDVKEDSDLGTPEFFETAYRVLLSRDQGPRLSRLILSLGSENAANILEKVK